MKTKLVLLLITCSFWANSFSQQWGLYTLYAPINSTQTYLIDTNGTTYKTWNSTSTQKTGFSVYLIPGDTLVRPVGRTGNSFTGGGMTGEVQKVTWDGTVVWDYVYSSTTYCLHHDIHPMPNGNVLMTAYESKTATEATAAGSSTAIIIWSEKLIEVHPTGATTGTIVWEWKLWDHLCQNYSSTKPNYVASISQNPQLMNINYNTSKDWIHMNGIDYNEALDQITFSSRAMNEIYVIDHSTTTAEAASHTGGNSGKGGDFLYRWGNPAAYGVTGTTANWNVVHDAHWISSDNPTYPNYLCGFNNGGGTGGKSCVDIINPPYSGSTYSYTPGSAMLPTAYSYRHTSTYTTNSNGASQQLPNGNMLLCLSVSSVLYEINSAGTTLWSKSITGAPANALRYTKCYVRGPMVTASTSSSVVCPGSQVTLNSAATSVTETSPTYTYEWSSGATTQNPQVTPISNTVYTVTITNTAIGCSSTASTSVNVYTLPLIPVVSQNMNVLTSTIASSYQWYQYGVIVPGETNQILNILTDGLYQVEITDANGCTAISDAVDFYYTGISQQLLENEVVIYPNPTNGNLLISNGMEYKVVLTNAMGTLLESKENINSIDLSKYSNGIYYLALTSKEGKVTNQKIILIK